MNAIKRKVRSWGLFQTPPQCEWFLGLSLLVLWCLCLPGWAIASLGSVSFLSSFSQPEVLRKKDQNLSPNFKPSRQGGKKNLLNSMCVCFSWVSPVFSISNKCFHRFANNCSRKIDLAMEHGSLDPSGIIQQWPQSTIQYHWKAAWKEYIKDKENLYLGFYSFLVRK